MNHLRLDGLLFSSDTGVRAVMNQTLDAFAIRTDVCTELVAALDAVTHRRLDTIIVDWAAAPNLTRVVSAARMSSPNSNATIIAMVNASAEMQAALLAGTNFIIHKPANLDHARRCMKAAYGIMLQQRRRSARCPVDIRVVATVAELGHIDAKITDISIGGLALQCKRPLQIGSSVSLLFSPSGTDQLIHVTGKVANSDKKGRAGIGFSLLPEQDLSRLVDWLAIELSKLEHAELPMSDFPDS